jgi:hypothetical protein
MAFYSYLQGVVWSKNYFLLCGSKSITESDEYGLILRGRDNRVNDWE